MMHVFQRGEKVLSAEAGSVLFRFGKPPRFSSGSVYSCDWSGSHPILTHTLQSQHETVPLEASKEISNAYSFSHPTFGNISFMKARWFEDRPEIMGERGILLSFQGWSEGLWYDGCFARWAGFRFTDLILPGREFRVEWGNVSGPLPGVIDFWEEHREYARKQSLVCAVQSKFAEFHRAKAHLEIEGESSENVLNLLLIRLAFPQQAFSIVPSSAGMKRLAQNLNISALNSVPKQGLKQRLAIDWGSAEGSQRILEWQMKKSPFIPGKLWETINPSGPKIL